MKGASTLIEEYNLLPTRTKSSAKKALIFINFNLNIHIESINKFD